MGGTLESLLKNEDLRLLVKSGYSYGKVIDDLIVRFNPKRIDVTVENVNMMRMLNFNRADYFFTSEEEAEGMIKSAGFPSNDYKFIHFSNMPPGNKRYLLCSMQVDQKTIEKLNIWIK